MPIETFKGNTFVAFLDISGFKNISKKEKKAYRVLNTFYSTGYNSLKKVQGKINGIFVSDCAILFVRSQTAGIVELKEILSVIKEINLELLRKEIILTTSIAFGNFIYEDRIVFRGIQKEMMTGNAYLKAYLDSERGHPKMEPGQCRILKDGLPGPVIHTLKSECNDDIFNLIEAKGKHFYFYWMLDNKDEIKRFKKIYSFTSELKYKAILKALHRDFDFFESLKKLGNI